MNRESEPEEMRAEYDIRGGVRGKYFERYHGIRVQILEAPWVMQQVTASAGTHASHSTRQIGADPVYPPLPDIVGSDR